MTEPNIDKKIILPGNDTIQSILSETVWLMEPDALQKFMAHVHQNLAFKEENLTPEMRASMYGEEDVDEKPYKKEGSIAVIELRGYLVKRASGFMAWLLGVKGMEAIGNIFKQALADTDVKGIFLDIDSPGGSMDGTMDLAEIIYNARGQKPILSFADGQMTSALQWIGSAADYVIAANETTILGSVGVYTVHMDFVDRAKELGIRPTVFSAGKFKPIGNEHEHLSASDKKYIQDKLDYAHTLFIESLSKNTGISVGKMDSDLKEAKVFMGSQAVAVGLANEIMPRDQAMSFLRKVADGDTTFDKQRTSAKTNQITLNLKGGVNNMDTELELKIKDLETKLATAQTLIGEMTDNKMKADFEAQIKVLKSDSETLSAKVTGLETSGKDLQGKVETLTTTATGNEVFVTAGKTHIEGMKTNIKKLSVQVEGDAFNQDLLDKQMTAFGNDITALDQFQASLETRRQVMLKSGTIEADEPGDGGGKKTDAQLQKLGSSLVPVNLRVVEGGKA